MTEMIRITDVEPLDGLKIRATFSDGAIKDLDPEVLYGLYEPASGNRIKPRTVRAPATATK